MAENEVALVVGAGPGLGAALGRCFSEDGMAVAVSARTQASVDAIAAEIGDGARAYGCDATDEGQVEALFTSVTADLGAPNLVVYNAGAFAPGTVLEIEAAAFEHCWRVGCLGGFLVGRAAGRAMVALGGGTILFTGATASLRGGANFANLAVGKFGLRALAQSMARALGPKGIHVAHTIIDGQISADRPGYRASDREQADAVLDPNAIAETYLNLHRQHRSAWTHEIDLRPWVEKF